MTADACWLLTVFLLSFGWLVWVWRQYQPPQVRSTAITTTVQRLLKPRTPDDCPACRHQATVLVIDPPAPPPIRPWHEMKSRRGAPKRITTQGFACPTPTCDYYRVTDAQVHALVGDGAHGQTERIQTFRCQACTTTFSARRNTPLYRLKTPSYRGAEVLSALAEGLDVAAAERVFGHRHATITTWLARVGDHSALLHDRWFCNLHLPHLQLDELRTRVRRRAHTLWLWAAVDPLTKLIPVLHLGARTQASAHAFIHDLHQRLAPACLPVFKRDGTRRSAAGTGMGGMAAMVDVVGIRWT